LALPLLARLHRPGKAQPSCPQIAREMLAEVLSWFPGRRFTLVGDGAYAAKALLAGLDERVTFVGRVRGDAGVYDPRGPKGKPGACTGPSRASAAPRPTRARACPAPSKRRPRRTASGRRPGTGCGAN